MIQATARILRNVIELRVGDALWTARSKAQAAFVAGRFSAEAVRDALDAVFHAAAGAERAVAARS